MTPQQTAAMIDQLTPSQRHSLTLGLLKRTKDQATFDARVYADLLVTTLKLAQRPDLADRVQQIHDDLK